MISHIPISPLDCFFDSNKDKRIAYLALSKFDYNYYLHLGYNVIYQEITLEDIFSCWTEKINKKESRTTELVLSKKAIELI